MQVLPKYILLQTLHQNSINPCVYVKKAINQTTHESLIIKYIDLQDDNADQKSILMFKLEIQVHSQLQHPNIIEVVDYSEEGILYESVNDQYKIKEIKAIFLATKFAQNGEVFDVVKRTGYLSESNARRLFLQLLSGLEYIHSKGFCHMDIKLENLVLEENFNLKIIDLGLALPLNNCSFRRCGTKSYSSPEIVNGSSFLGDRADLFSAGVCLFYIATGIPPFKCANASDDLYQLIIENKQDLFWKIFEYNLNRTFSFDFKNLINKLLLPENKGRLQLKEIKEHPFISQKNE